MVRRIFRKFDMQSFIGTVGLAAVFSLPATALLDSDANDWRGWGLMAVVAMVAVAAVGGIVGHLVVEAGDEKRAEETKPTPILEGDEPYTNTRYLFPADHAGKMQNAAPEPGTFVNQKWRNMPQHFGPQADARDVLADIYYYVGDSPTPIKAAGRWGCCKPQPAAQGLMTPVEQGTVDFLANGKPHELDIAIRYADGEAYVYNDETQRNPRNEAHRLGPNNLIKVELRGNNIKKSYSFWLKIEGDSFLVEPVVPEER
jgi:hypothetical protein